MTIRDMIMMATGHDHFILQGYSASDDRPVRDAIENDDWVQYALEFDVPYKPGTYWKYNNFGPYLASVIIQERTGERLVDWLKPRLDMDTFSGDVPEIMHTVEMVMPDREFLSYRSRMPVLLLLPMNLTPDLFLTAYGTISFPS